MECPNSCGTNNLQHQHLEEHVSTQCPLTYVECEFSDAGCDAKVYKKDLPSHLGENMVTHMSLLARENRKLKQQLKEQPQDQLKRIQKQEEKIHEQCEEIGELKSQLIEQGEAQKKLVEEIQMQRDDTVSFLSRVAPIDLRPLIPFTKHEISLSEPFYSHIGGYKLQLEIQSISKWFYQYKCRYTFLDSEFKVPPSGILYVTTEIKNHGETIETKKLKVNFGKKASDYFKISVEEQPIFTFCVSQIAIKT